MKKRKPLAMGLAVAMAVSCLAGCGGDDKKASSDGKTEQVLNISNNSVVVGLNPLINTTGPDNAAFNMVLDPLVKRVTRDGNTYEIIPAAAESWDISEDGLTYTFHMNKDAKWSDGTKVTANDFEFTFQKMATPSVAATNAWLFDGIIENFSEALYDQGKKPEEIGVHAIDEDTLEIKIIHPASYFLELVSSSAYPVNKAMYEELGSDYATSETKTVFNGPFKIESWSQNTEMVVVRNDQYWGADDVKLDKINYKIIQESATAVQSYINGELDVIGTTDANWGKTIEEQGESESYQVPDSSPEFFMLNAANEYLCNEKIRQALSVAYDRQEMIDTLRNGKGVPIYSMMPDTIQVGEKTYTELVGGKNHFVQELQNEIKDPKALLIEGLKELGKDPDPSKVTIRYASRGTDELSKKIAEWMKQQWESVLGINVEIDMMEWNIMWDKIDAGDYDIATGGWGPYYNEPSALLQLFDPDNGYFNAEKTGWSGEDPKKYQELLNEAKYEVDDQKKAELYLQAEELVVKSGLIEPTYLEEAPTFVKKYVKNYFVSTVGQVDFSQVYIEK